MRGASRIFAIIIHFLELDILLPSWHTGRLWILRLGLYKLEREKVHSDDWILIVDHTVQSGNEKCLIIFGIRKATLPEGELYLNHEDVEPIALMPVTHSNGQVVYEQLEKVVEKIGVPRQIVSDHGSDIKSGIERFCQVHKNTCYTYDIKHKCAAIIKRELKDDADWQEFIKQASLTSSRVRQTSLAGLACPNQRSKSRYMNVDVLVKWGCEKLCYLDHQEQGVINQYDVDQVNEKLGWLRQYREHLQDWENLIDLSETTISFINSMGIYKNMHSDLEGHLGELPDIERVNRIRRELVSFIKDQAKDCRPDERLLGSSELIESMIGKLKNIEQDQAKSGFTGLLLSIAAYVSKTTTDIVHKAMETVPTKKVMQWFTDNIGKSVQSKRKAVADFIKKSEQITDEINGAIYG